MLKIFLSIPPILIMLFGVLKLTKDGIDFNKAIFIIIILSVSSLILYLNWSEKLKWLLYFLEFISFAYVILLIIALKK
jgi:hypothetical protein